VVVLTIKDGKPLVDLEAVTFILEALEGMQVGLDVDPLSGGPKRLQGKIAKARNYLSKVQRWWHIVGRADHTLNRMLLLLNSEIQIREDDLLANDPEVQRAAQQSIRDREAITHCKLKDERMEKFRLEQAVHDTTTMLRALSAKRTDLKDTISRLRDQMRLCQDELSLGMKWGSKVPGLDLTVEAQPEMSRAVSEDADMLINDVLGSGDGASDEDFEVPSHETVRHNRNDPPPKPRAEKVPPFPGEEAEAAPPPAPDATPEQVDGALDALDMDELDTILSEEDSPKETTAPSVGDGLPEDFWD
jgi:hypothetical protein